MCFLWEFFLKVFDSGQSDVSSGNSMTTCCVVNANILNTLIQLGNSKHLSRAISRLSEGRKIHILSCNFNYSVPLSPCSRSSRNTYSSRFLTARQIAQKHKLSKKFPPKNTSQYPWLARGRDKRLTIPWGFVGFMVNQCAVLWCGRDLWVKTSHSHVPCFALCRKTTPNKQRAAKLYKMAMNWAKVTQEKQQQAQVYVSTIYFYIHAYISTF